MRFLVQSLAKHMRREENLSSKIMLAGYVVLMPIAFFLGHEVVGLICFIGMLHELHRIEMAGLRREIRAKRMWHEGEV